MGKTCFHKRVALSMMNNSSAFTQLDYSSRITYFFLTIQLSQIQTLSLYWTYLFKNLHFGTDTYPFKIQSAQHINFVQGLECMKLGIKINLDKILS